MPRTLIRMAGVMGVCCAAVLAAAVTAVHATIVPPTPDPGFGTLGLVVTDVGGRDDTATAVAVRRDATVLVAGSSVERHAPWYEARTILTRYRANGSVDRGFGNNGVLLTGPGDAQAMSTDRRGRIIVAGGGWSGDAWPPPGGFAVARFLADGSPDRSFGGGTGRVHVAASTVQPGIGGCGRAATGIAAQSDGKLIIVGHGGCGDAEHELEYVFVLRLDAAGRPDPAFDGDGQVSIVEGGGDSCIGGAGVLVQRDDRILVVEEQGFCNVGSRVFRLHGDGGRDQSFGTRGVAHVPLNLNIDIALDRRGRAVLVGAGGPSIHTYRRLAVTRLTRSGTADRTFGRNGVTVTVVGRADATGHAVSPLPDGRLLVAGTTHAPRVYPQSRRAFLAIFRSNGTLDRRFARAGTWGFAPGRFPTIADAAVDRHGRVLVSGSVRTPGPRGTDIYVERFRIPARR